MSISGLHITMFAWAGVAADRRPVAPLGPADAPSVPGAAGQPRGRCWAVWGWRPLYALFSGWGVPAQRTIWMLATVVLLRQSGRQWPWLQAWLLAMAVVVAAGPVGLDAGRILAVVCRGGRAVCYRFRSCRRVRHARKADLQDFGRVGWPAAGRPAAPGARAMGGHAGARRRCRCCCSTRCRWSACWPMRWRFRGSRCWSRRWRCWALCMHQFGMLAAWAVRLLARCFCSGWRRWPLASVGGAPRRCGARWPACWAVACWRMRLPWHWRALGVPLLLPVLLWQPARVAPGQFELLAADVGQGNAVLVRTATPQPALRHRPALFAARATPATACWCRCCGRWASASTC